MVMVTISVLALKLRNKQSLTLIVGRQERLNLISSLKMRRDYAKKISTKLERSQFKSSVHEDARKVLSLP